MRDRLARHEPPGDEHHLLEPAGPRGRVHPGVPPLAALRVVECASNAHAQHESAAGDQVYRTGCLRQRDRVP